MNKAVLQIPVLCYHSWTIDGPLYANNDHVALEHDLQTLARKGYQILPLTELVAVLRGELSVETLAGKKLVCITCDDGRDLDYLDYWSEETGKIPSFHALLEQSRTWLPQHSAGPRAVSFVIASTSCRRILDVECGNSLNLWNDFWWEESTAKGILGIANHSWDHVHQCLDTVRQQDNKKGSFFEIATFADAEAQIADAQRYIQSRTNQRGLPFFCYPYGQVPAYLRDEYFPAHGGRVGVIAAFSTSGLAVNEYTCIWDIPRFVCGYHWKSPEEFETMLDTLQSVRDEATDKPLNDHKQSPALMAPVDQVFTVVEVDNAEFFVGKLFRRRFHIDSFPKEPRHFVAFAVQPDGSLISLGYVHYTIWEGCALCGGLVFDDRHFRRLPLATRHSIRQAGGVAELLLRQSFARLPDATIAIWGHVGNKQSEAVCLRVGFQRTASEYIMVVWRDSDLSESEKLEWIERVADLGPF